jgi:hypothetical protein
VQSPDLCPLGSGWYACAAQITIPAGNYFFAVGVSPYGWGYYEDIWQYPQYADIFRAFIGELRPINAYDDAITRKPAGSALSSAVIRCPMAAHGPALAEADRNGYAHNKPGV